VSVEAAAARVVHEHVAAFNARDVERPMAGFTDDAVWVTGQDVVTGRHDLAVFFAAAISGLLPTLQVLAVVAEADTAAAELLELYQFQQVARTALIAGFYTVEDGRISRAKIYREGSADPAAGTAVGQPLTNR
jgi:hypothetical protein